MPTFKKMFGRGKKTAGTKDSSLSDKVSAGTDTKKLQPEQVETAGDCPPMSIMKEDRNSKSEEIEGNYATDDNPNWHQAEKEGLQWPPPGVELGCDQTIIAENNEDSGIYSMTINEGMPINKRLEDEPSEVPSLYNTLETQFQQANKTIIDVPTFSECQDPVVFGIRQSVDQDGAVELTFSRETSPTRQMRGMVDEQVVDAGQLEVPPADTLAIEAKSPSVSSRQGSPERSKSAKRTRRHRREVPTRPEGDETTVQHADGAATEDINELPEKPYAESEGTTRHHHRQVVIQEQGQQEFPAPPTGLPEGEAGETKVNDIKVVTGKPLSGSGGKPPSPQKSRRSKATSLSLHRRKHSLENVIEAQVGELVAAEDVSASSSDELKRTQTLPALIRHVEPEGKKRHSRNRKESSSSRERSGMKKLLARMGSPSEETSSSGATTTSAAAATDKSQQEPSASARPERTASLLGGWVKASRRKSSSVGPPTNGRSASASAVSGGTQPSSGSVTPGAEPGTTVVSRTSSPFAAGVDLEQLTVELNKLQCELRVLADSNSDTRMRHESDVALMKQEVGSIVFEITGLKGELERFRQEYAQSDLQRKMEVHTILPLTRTDRSSLTLHCCDAAEQALNEQLARLHEEGPLVPYEGNDLLPMSILAHVSHRDDQKQVTWGNRVGRGVGRTFVMVLTGLRQLWYFYLTMYPMI